MISALNTYALNINATPLKKFEMSLQNAAGVGVAAKTKAAPETGIAGDSTSAEGGIVLTGAGLISQTSTGLFATVSEANPGQGIVQMIVAQRGYEAYLNVIKTQDEITEYTLDTFA
jgi:hypothetical protein